MAYVSKNTGVGFNRAISTILKTKQFKDHFWQIMLANHNSLFWRIVFNFLRKFHARKNVRHSLLTCRTDHVGSDTKTKLQDVSCQVRQVHHFPPFPFVTTQRNESKGILRRHSLPYQTEGGLTPSSASPINSNPR